MLRDESPLMNDVRFRESWFLRAIPPSSPFPQSVQQAAAAGIVCFCAFMVHESFAPTGLSYGTANKRRLNAQKRPAIKIPLH
jgi:hypothetical protein